jgi:hypothetical protein
MTLLEHALAYARRGCRVFPLHGIVDDGCTCRAGDGCPNAGKHPWGDGWQTHATTDAAQIRRWWKNHPDMNLGVVTGATSGLLVLDVDPAKGGDESLRDLERVHGPLPETVIVLTGGGGRHLEFQHPGTLVPDSVGRLGPGLDVRGDGGLVVGVGSRHRSGRTYVYEVTAEPDTVGRAVVPPWLLERMRMRARAQQPGDGTPLVLREGERNDRLFKLACVQRRYGIGVDALRAFLEAVNRAHCVPPLDAVELETIAESAARFTPTARCVHCGSPLSQDHARREEDAASAATDPAAAPGVAEETSAAPTPSASPRISRRLSTILADPAALEPPAVVVPRLAWRGRTTLLAAREKAGKSTMATAAAAAVTRKALWLGDPTPRGVVLWVALEEHVSDVASRLNEWKADAERVYVIDSLGGVDDPMDALHRETSIVAPTLLVVDTLSAFVDAIGSRPDPGSSTAWTPIMTGLTRIARDTDAAVLIVHHARRSDGAYRDSSAIGAGVDAIVEMADGQDADVRALRIRARWREGDYSVRLVGTEYKFASGELSLDARVLLHVKGHPGCSQREVRDGVGSRTRDVVAAVRRLLDSGALEDRGTEAGMRLYLSEKSVSQSGSRDAISDPPGNTSGTTPGSGNFPAGKRAEPLSGTTAFPDSKPLGDGSGNTPDLWGDV